MAPTEPSVRAEDEHQPPSPPAWLASKSLPIETIRSDRWLYRVHSEDPIFFGPPPGTGPIYRFDSPDRAYGAMYVGLELESALVETLLRNPELQIVSQSEVDRRRWSRVRGSRNLRMAKLYGNGLSAMGATAEVSTGRYGLSRKWSKAIWDHPDSVDGLLYRSKHDNDRLCAAIFSREGIDMVAEPPETFDPGWLNTTLRDYGKVLDT
jgi:RES domain